MHYEVGVIADTHGLLRPEAIEFLKRCDLIVHAGDVGNPDILTTLKSILTLYSPFLWLIFSLPYMVNKAECCSMYAQ
jgi:predicted phosphodiesterase